MADTSQQTPTPNSHKSLYRQLLAAVLIVLVLAVGSLSIPRAKASPQAQGTTTPQLPPTPTFDLSRLDKPLVTGDNSEQLRKGSIIYWGVCLTCHGDRGQGMTTEWRDAYGDDQNCWQSGCHGSDHPTPGFIIPTDLVIPPVAGPGKLARFKNAQELHDFILASMPWWNPGDLTDEEAWQVSAYILRLHKVMPTEFELKDTNASAITTLYAVPQPGNDRAAVLSLTGILGLAAIGLLIQDIGRTKPGKVERPNFFHHLHPPSIPALQARLRYTLGAGGLAVLLCLILLVTGILEMFYYIPVPTHAAISVETITSLVPYGALTRNLHYWSAQALMIVITVHLLRVVLTGAYAKHRRLNYLIGLGMLVLVLLLDFTGYVLRWDEGIRWALIVGTNLLKTIPWIGNNLYQLVVGGAEPGLSAIERFYTWHIFVLTGAMIIMGAWHIFRVRRDGGIAVPPPAQRIDLARISRFDLVRREILFMVIAGVILLAVSYAFPAPIERPIAQAAVDIESAKAPWFFLWVQQLLKIGQPFLWGVAVPVLLLIVLALFPFILPQTEEQEYGRWFPKGNRIAQIILLALVLIVILLTILATIPTAQL
jgi:quinol-cytochrome oxidoreductase complex cytochrome b subunit/mono/diheme cytochrome c family protein